MSEQEPLEPFENGARDEQGRFKPGNPGGPGNPRSRYARQVRARLDEALFKACSPDRLLAAVDAVLKCAESGDVAALKLICERISGPPVSVELSERIEALEDRNEARRNS